MMHFTLVTLFPQMLEAVTNYGITSRAVKKGLITVDAVNPREFTQDKHRTVDDRPYGGGPGMVMMPEPLTAALTAARSKGQGESHVVYLSPQGQPLDQTLVESLATHKHMVLLAGRYEGIDERVIEQEVDQEISLGDFVLSGGELPAMTIIDAVTRMLPGALGHEDSAVQDSFRNGLLDCPHYTRPEEFSGRRVPDVLLSGHHGDIERWRMKQALGRTWLRRPELLERLNLTEVQQQLLAEFRQEHQSS